jgi:transposase
MGTTRFSETEIIYAVKQVEMGVPAKEIARKYGVSDKTVCLWSLTNSDPALHGLSLSRHRSRRCHPAAP